MRKKLLNIEQKEVLVHTLRWIVKGRWIMIIGSLLGGLVQKYVGVSLSSMSTYLVLLLVFIVTLYNFLYYLYLRKGERRSYAGLRTVSILQIILDQLVFTALIYFSGGIESLSFVFYVMPILVSTALFGTMGILLLSFINSIFYGAIILTEYYQIIPHLGRYQFDPGFFQNPAITFSNAYVVTTTIILSAAFATFIAKMIRDREKQIISERDKVNAIIENLTHGILIINKENKIIFVNPVVERLLHVKREKILGRFVERKLFSRRFNKIYSLFFEKLKEQKKVVKEVVFRDPEQTILRVVITPLIDEKKVHYGRMILISDVTREKEIDRMKSEFISIAAHQLRTPLSAVKWVLRMIIDEDMGKITEEQKKFLLKGYQSNERMVRLVNDLLDVSRIEEGRFQYKFVNTQIEEVVEGLLPDFKSTVTEKQLKLIFKKPARPMPKVKVDSSKIRIVIQNLIENAVRYTPPKGKITISLKLLDKYLQFQIKDTGVGIPQNQRSKLFTKFFRADNVIRLQTDGTGLGLFIIKNIIRKHGGKVWVESEENKGSTFYFTVPLDAELIPKQETEFEKFIESF